MNREDCVEIGYIAKAHGIQGAVKLVLDVHDAGEYLGVKKLYLAKKDKPLVAHKVKSIQGTNAARLTLKLQGINDRETAESLKGSTIFYPIELLPELPEGQFYFFEIIGFQVVDQTAGPIGTIREILDLPNNELMVVDHEEKEILVPLNKPVLLRADKAERVVHVDLPAGLLELYVGEGGEED